MVNLLINENVSENEQINDRYLFEIEIAELRRDTDMRISRGLRTINNLFLRHYHQIMQGKNESLSRRGREAN